MYGSYGGFNGRRTAGAKRPVPRALSFFDTRE
jgi:hypothetical protein